MRYAKVVLPLPVKGPFDYIIPKELETQVKAGSRVLVNFGRQESVGFVVALSRHSAIARLKNISKALDIAPSLSQELLSLTQEIANYYCASWGEVISAALPDTLRRKTQLQELLSPTSKQPIIENKPVFIHSLSKEKRWEKYLDYIKAALAQERSAIVLLPDVRYAKSAAILIEEKLGVSPALFAKKGKRELEEWIKARQGEAKVVVGTRSAIFAPLTDLGLIIIEDEQDSVYKQEQVPHYHAREAAFMRAHACGALVVLGGFSPSLESFYLTQKDILLYDYIHHTNTAPEIKIVDMKGIRQINRKIIFSKYLEDSIYSTLNSQGKVLLFLNRRGFATFAQCSACGKVLSCPRCEVGLVYHFDTKELLCHYCNYKITKMDICPECKSGYIRYSGLGTEKIESEIARIFPSARIKRLESASGLKLEDADIFISTSSIIKEGSLRFDLVGVLSIDNSLHRFDFRSGEKVFSLLSGILGLTGKRMIVQTALPGHPVFAFLEKMDFSGFYRQELEQRKPLALPPFKHLGLVKVRGPSHEKATLAAENIFKQLKECKAKGVKVLSLNPGQPAKLRGNYYYHILLNASSALAISRFLAKNLRRAASGSATVTIDIDPL